MTRLTPETLCGIKPLTEDNKQHAKVLLFQNITNAINDGICVAADIYAHLCTLKDYGATPAEIAVATEIHANDECEIDEPALVSRADDGYWVQAWVWVDYKGDGERQGACGTCV